jgi:hypothetical protein
MIFANPEKVSTIKDENGIIAVSRRFMIGQFRWFWEKLVHIGYFVPHVNKRIFLKGIEDPIEGET